LDAIVAQSVTKTYRVGVGRARIREMLPPPIDVGVRRLFPAWWLRNTFDALDGVSISIPAGSAVGLVGHNGAGKTTFLKIVAGVTSPSRGSVHVSGRIAALIDALVGFHPELTGRENTYLLGAMHGFSRRTMAARIDQILDFAEIEALVDTPLKRFSAGMAARLGFAALTALDVELLLVDEVLAVGDASFQRKCVEWLQGYRERGGTLVFVSHNLSLVRNMTERAVWLDHGRVVGDGPSGTILTRYVGAMERRRDAGPRGLGRHEIRTAMVADGRNRWGAGGAWVDEVHVEDPAGNGSALEMDLTYDAPALDAAVFCVGFVDEAGNDVGTAASQPMAIPGDHGAVRCVIKPLPLRTGVYFPVVAILSPDGRVRDRWKLDRAVVVQRDGDLTLDLGPIEIPADWSTGS